jgi:UDP-glucose:(heptosyl)LPS alpha-1,3-glucosyltransferase
MSKKYSGATRGVYEQIRFFDKMGYKIYIIADNLNKKDVDETKSSNVIFIKSFYWPWQKRLNRRLQYIKSTEKIIKKIQPDITISHGDYPYADYYFTRNNICLAHERIYGEAINKKDEMYQIHVPIFTEKNYKKIIANSQLVKDDICNRFDIEKNLVEVIYPSTYQKEFTEPNKKEIQMLKISLGIDEDLLLVGLVTSGDFRKRNLKQYLDAIDLLPKNITDKCYFIFVGKDQVYEEAKLSLQENKYKERIKHIPIINNVSVLFHALDLFVLPAKIEEFGRVVAEAMACETPVITTEWVGASELLEGISRQFIYDGESADTLASMMEQVLSNQKLREDMAQQNKISVEINFEENTYKKLAKALLLES